MPSRGPWAQRTRTRQPSRVRLTNGFYRHANKEQTENRNAIGHINLPIKFDFAKLFGYFKTNSSVFTIGHRMDGKQFRAWRERLGLTQQQVADRMGVTRTTVQNWESADAIPQTVEMSCDVWEPRLKQENPNLGPVTLVYSDGPMFVNPYGPRGR